MNEGGWYTSTLYAVCTCVVSVWKRCRPFFLLRRSIHLSIIIDIYVVMRISHIVNETHKQVECVMAIQQTFVVLGHTVSLMSFEFVLLISYSM